MLALRPERSAQVRMPPTAPRAPRGERPGPTGLTAGPVVLLRRWLTLRWLRLDRLNARGSWSLFLRRALPEGPEGRWRWQPPNTTAQCSASTWSTWSRSGRGCATTPPSARRRPPPARRGRGRSGRAGGLASLDPRGQLPRAQRGAFRTARRAAQPRWGLRPLLAERPKNEPPQGRPGAGRQRPRCDAYASSFPSGRGIPEACRGH